jgi:hypothetical protein
MYVAFQLARTFRSQVELRFVVFDLQREADGFVGVDRGRGQREFVSSRRGSEDEAEQYGSRDAA